MPRPLHLDSSGRIVIPKSLRDALGIDETTPLEARRAGRKLILTPQEVVPEREVLNNGWTIFNAGPSHNTDIHRVVHEEYEDRARRFSTG